MEELKTTSDVIIIFDFQRDYSKADYKELLHDYSSFPKEKVQVIVTDLNNGSLTHHLVQCSIASLAMRKNRASIETWAIYNFSSKKSFVRQHKRACLQTDREIQ